MGGRQDGRLVRERIVRHRRAQHEGRIPGQSAGPAGSADLERPAAVVPVQPGRAECRDLPSPRRRQPDDHQPGRHLHPGQLDARPPDAAGCPAVRSRLELRAGRTERHHRDVVPESGANRHREDAGRRCVQRPHAADRRRLRPVRHRQNGAQIELGPLPRVRRERFAVHLDEPGVHGRAGGRQPRLDRHQRRTRWSTATC